MHATCPTGLRLAAAAVAAVGLASAPALAAPVPCGPTTLDVAASSDTPVSLPTFNVGQKVILEAVTPGVTPDSFAWTIDGPHIKDYEERLGTAVAPTAWSTTALGGADLAQPRVEFYWRPAPGQIHPSNIGPDGRGVSVTVTLGGASCTNSALFQVERNMTDPDRQPEDYYTSNHRAPTETNPRKGRVIDDHFSWHMVGGAGIEPFLPWHGRFLQRFNRWREEFGYAPTVPWYPGSPLPGGIEMQHSPRQASYDPTDPINRIPTWFTIAGSPAPSPLTGRRSLGEYPSLVQFSNELEGGFHGNVHCNVGPATGGFFAPDGPGFGSMCRASSPKDPIFWRWHGFIDLMYRNYCGLRGLACASGPDPATDAWMVDNAADLANGGTEPSPGPHWLSIDIWNRTAPHPSCQQPNENTGTIRDCGSSADHENPVAGLQNFLYATLRNDRPSANLLAYAEVAVYVANASTGLAWPASFTQIPETRQFITLHLAPGAVADIGPVVWVPPSPTPSDHWCLYVRVMTVQDLISGETADVGANTAAHNSIVWRNLKIVQPFQMAGAGRDRARFMVRNIRPERARIDLRVEAPEAMLAAGRVTLRLDERLARAFREGDGQAHGLAPDDGGFTLVEPEARLQGLLLDAGAEGALEALLEGREPAEVKGAVTITQLSDGRVDGGVTLALAEPRAAVGGPDLVVDLSGPEAAVAGEDIGPRLRATAANIGRAAAGGTLEAGDDGYMIDLLLSADDVLPPGFATFQRGFAEDVLLGGGRVSQTQTLAPGERIDYRAGALIPADTPAGTYCLGARIDPGKRLAESDTTNNTACHKLEIAAGTR